MPHKHKRKRGDNDDFELPPSQKALPLPVSSGRQNSGRTSNQPRGKLRRKDRTSNDAPRAFRRIMAFAQGKRPRSGLDNGDAVKNIPKILDTQTEDLRIKPGEDMRSFSARVDAALPVAGLATKTKTKDGKDSLGLKVNRTRKERKMHKLYDQWRAEERKIQEQREEERELAAERELDNESSEIFADHEWAATGDAGSRKKSKKNRGKGEDEDPWLELKRKRGETKIGLNDVVQAPPELLHKSKRKQLEVAGAAVDVVNIPKAAGSLRRREELQAARGDVVEAYRRIREHEQAKIDAQGKKHQRRSGPSG